MTLRNRTVSSQPVATVRVTLPAQADESGRTNIRRESDNENLRNKTSASISNRRERFRRGLKELFQFRISMSGLRIAQRA